MAASVELKVILRDGTTKTFSNPVGQGDPPVDMKTLQKSLLSLQHESNSYLTQLVEQERERLKTSENGEQILQQKRNDDEESEDLEEEDEEEKDEEPVKKKQKR